jgi:hypothetical protein
MEPTIDERLQALAQSLELLSVNVHALQDETRRFEVRQKRLDERERRARRAMMHGIQAYLQVLNEEPGGEEPNES